VKSPTVLKLKWSQSPVLYNLQAALTSLPAVVDDENNQAVSGHLMWILHVSGQ
jgi:hypothetical protein